MIHKLAILEIPAMEIYIYRLFEKKWLYINHTYFFKHADLKKIEYFIKQKFKFSLRKQIFP